MKVKIGRTTWGALCQISTTVSAGGGAHPHIKMCKLMERQLLAGLAAAIKAESNRSRMAEEHIHPDTMIVVTVDVNIEPYSLVEY